MLHEYRGLMIRPVSPDSLGRYLELFRVAFPSYKTSESYLNWLYFENPNGPAVGFDAYDGDLLVAHYVCVPIVINAYEKPSLLALNTCTHPKYQGRGLLKVLANNTYEKYGSNFSCVVGVANSQAIKPLTRHLGFFHLGDLELRFGSLASSILGRRVYSEVEVKWRANCPGKELSVTKFSEETVKFTRKYFKIFPISAICPVNKEPLTQPIILAHKKTYGVTVDWQKNVKPKFFLPKKFKPSPLSFVFRPLSETDSSRITSWVYPDFDAI